MRQLSASVDRDILEQRIFFALKAIREARNCTTPQALDVFNQRYEELRRDRPDDFTLPREVYGQDFYS
ncbi:hypothetical protein ACFC1R_36595 [Kitasatospora sp. NPDC056138]|uniref:hypothetical protein n=1 Tax=Kitasatospora sp. NPDC056138 TaxID=3345724 RepID=UPI0035D81D78